jgi:hypothetical protein
VTEAPRRRKVGWTNRSGRAEIANLGVIDLEICHERRRMRAFLRRLSPGIAAVVVAALLALAACDEDEPSGPGDGGTGEGRIGPAGGTVQTDDENAAVIVPAGALTALTQIRIRRLPEDSLPPPLLAKRRVSDSYRFSPDGQTFLSPVEIQIFFDADLLPAGVGLADLTIGKLDQQGQIEELTGVHILRVEDRIRLQATKAGIGGLISAFSPFAVWIDDPDTATLEIATRTQGESLDPDGYAVGVDGGAEQPLGVNDTLRIEVSVGVHTVALSGVADNCTLDGEALRSVEAPANGLASVVFDVLCAAPAGALRISAITTGPDVDPDGYQASVDGGAAQPLAVNGSVLFAGLAAGRHTVLLSGVAPNCALSGGDTREVSVTSGATAELVFSVACAGSGGSSRKASLDVTVQTSGQPQGFFTAVVDESDSRDVSPDGSVTFGGLDPGFHEAELELPSDCVADGFNPRTVFVRPGDENRTSFEVSCAGD